MAEPTRNMEGSGACQPLPRHISPTTSPELSEYLEDYIQKCDVYEEVSESGHVTRDISQWVDQWVADIATRQGIETQADLKLGACLKIFGSHSFGVAMKGGDLDLVCLVPRFVSRSEFFTTFLSRLKKQNVLKVRPIEAAYVPVISFLYKNVEVDMCLSVMSMDVIPCDLDLLSDGLLDNMDEVSVRSLSGVRENETLLSLVPDEDMFRRSLKVIKYWAKCNGLHHYAMGFPGGIGWAIMVARVCQMHPYTTVSVLVANFFKVFLYWSWPTPVLLKLLHENSRNLAQWNPQVSSADGRHPVPVITPAYPEHNATFTISESTRHVFQQELARAQEITEKVVQGQAEWAELFVPQDFFSLYRHYLMVVAKASSVEDLLGWSGLVESRLRILTRNLERQATITLVHPHTKGYTEKVQGATGDVEVKCWLLGLKLAVTPGSHLDLVSHIKDFQQSVTHLAEERHIYKLTMKIEVRHLKRSQLVQYFPDQVANSKVCSGHR